MDNIRPLVSVIIACFNAESYIDVCLNSLFEQTYQNYEIVVCDDGSTDLSLAKLQAWEKKDSRIILLHNNQNLFAAESRNRCFECANGDYFLIQDIDDVSSPFRIERLISALENNKEVDFASSQMEAFVDDYRKPFKLMDVGIEKPSKKNFLWGLPFHHPATLFSRKCINAVGGYRIAKETRRCEDYDLFMRLFANGYRGINISEPLYYYRLDVANIQRREFRDRIDEYKVRKEGFKRLGLMPIGYLFVLKPFIAHFVQKIRYLSLGKRK